jgi:peptidoglycan/xylan/chitin deacetylase (PgdA/CDA1 family)
MIVGLRHDLDTVYGLRWGLPRIISIEKKYGVRSTFFVRVDVIRSDKDKSILKKIADENWEIGLHLINTINDSGLPSPECELERLKKLLGIPIYGVTPCGSTIGFKGDATWKVMDSLGLKYMEGYGTPDFEVNTFVFPTHLSLDIHYVRNFGEKEGYQKFKVDLLQQLKQDEIATVLVHPEWFVRSVGGSGLMKIPLTLIRKKMMDKIYDRFLCEFKWKVEFRKYIEMYHLLASNSF